MTEIDIDKKYKKIFRQITKIHRQYYLIKILEKTFRFLSISFIAISIFLFLNLLFDISPTIRQGFIGIVFLWYLFYTIYYILPNLREIFSPSQKMLQRTAIRIGRMDKNIQDALLNYLQIYHKHSSSGSTILRNMALNQLWKKFSDINLKPAFSLKTLRVNARPLLLASLFCSFVYLFFPNQVGSAFRKIIFPWKNFQEELPIKVINLSGNQEILRNNSVVLRGKVEGVKPLRLFLILQSLKKFDDENLKKSDVKKLTIPVPDKEFFEYKLNHVQNPFQYYFIADLSFSRFRSQSVTSEMGTILIKERPVIRNFQVKIMPPAYSGLSPTLLPANDGEITALRGSRVEINIETDKQLTKAYILFSDSTQVPLRISGHTAHGSFIVEKNILYTIKVFDQDSIANYKPVEYSIFPLNDEYPFAEITQPGKDVDIENELELPLFIELHDDYGFSNLFLKGYIFRASSPKDSSEFQLKLPYKIVEKGKAFCGTIWDLTPFYLVPDDYLQYYVEVWDNDAFRGPKVFRTRTFTIRFPSLLEILDRAEEAQEEQIEDVKELVETSKELKEKLEEIQRELKRSQEVSWEQKQRLKNQIGKQAKSLEKLEEFQKKLNDFIESLDRRDLLSAETLEKYFELQKMFQELATPELKKALEQLSQALQQADPRQIQKALERLQFSVEQFEKSIERTYELFKRVQLEQKMDELVRLAEEIGEEQQKVNEKLAENRLTIEEFDRLQEKEKMLQQHTDYLDQKIDETNEVYRELMETFSQKLDAAKSLLKNAQIQKMMTSMQKQMNITQKEEALETGKNIQANLDQLQSLLQMAKQNMLQQQKQELADAMQKTIRDMLTSSFEQEKIMKRTERITAASAQINHIAQKQFHLQTATLQLIKQLIQISNQTFFISPQMNKIMSNILKAMQETVGYLENRNPRQASRAQQRAMAGFNQALLNMQNSLSQMAQASSASGFQEFLQQLQQMVGQQGQLNQETLSLFQKLKNEGRLPLSSSDLARLAAQQEMIKKSLEELTKQTGSRRDILGRMDELADEMEKVVKDLKAQRLDRKVIERQERILSRLLDAQKSMREKEFSKKRKAERENQVLVKSPPQLRKELLEKKDKLRKALMEALQEGYSQEYREYIKIYFETLSQKKLELH